MKRRLAYNFCSSVNLDHGTKASTVQEEIQRRKKNPHNLAFGAEENVLLRNTRTCPNSQKNQAKHMKKVPSHALMGVHSMIEMEAGFVRVQPRVLPSTGAACANSSA